MTRTNEIALLLVSPLLLTLGCAGQVGQGDDDGETEGAVTSPIAFVQIGVSTPPNQGQTVATTAFPNAQVAGNLDVVVVGWNDATSNVTSVVDSRGNHYALAIGPTRGTALSQSIYYATDIAAGANTVTVSFDNAAPSIDIRVLEYSGLDPTSPLDVSVGASGSSASPSSGARTTTAANELVLGAGMTFTTFTAAGAGATSRVITHRGDLAEDRTVSAAGSYSATGTMPGSTFWVMQMATFKAAATSAFPLFVSSAPSHAAARSLSGATLSGLAYVFTGDAAGGASPTGITQVSYYLDDPAMSGAATHVERFGPYDFIGSDGANGLPWDTSQVAAGTHTLTQQVTTASGAVETDTATFTIGTGTKHTVALAWMKGTGSDPVTYDVDRADGACVSPFAGSRIASGLTSPAYTDASVVSRATYCYAVSAHDAATALESALSNAVTVVIP